MSLQRRTVSSILAGRGIRKSKDGQQLQEAAVQLLDQNQNLSHLFQELENPVPWSRFWSQSGEQSQAASDENCCRFSGQLLGGELRRQAERCGVAVGTVSVKAVLDRLEDITGRRQSGGREMLLPSQRVQLCVLLEFSKELLAQQLFCPRLLWAEYRRAQTHPNLELIYFLHQYNILTLNYVVESDESSPSWLPGRLKALCSWTPPQDEEDTQQVQRQVLSTVVAVLIGAENISQRCSSMMDDMLSWFLDENTERAEASQRWIQTFDASLCGVSVSPDVLQRFFTSCLTRIFTCNPGLTVSDAISLQNEWTFAKAERRLTSLYYKLAMIFSVDQLLLQLQQVLETQEVNWKHVLVFVSSLLVYDPSAQSSLRGMLSQLLTSGFEAYDLEKLISAFLLARQGALEGAGVFPSYSDWFKLCFGGCSGFHANSKKSLVFLLKFLSDLVPFEPALYLKVHLLHPPYVPPKQHGLLLEYVTLAKTRLADLKEPVEDMALYEVSGAPVQPQCQVEQDVEKAVSLFESSGRISAAIMEASIFRRPYFLTRFLPALLKPRMLPLTPDARIDFIEALKKAEKIPAAQYSSYVESCRQQRQQNDRADFLVAAADPLAVLKSQLHDFAELLVDQPDAEMSAQLSRVALTLTSIFPAPADDLVTQAAVSVDTDSPALPELDLKAVDLILQSFCQSLMNVSRANPPNKQSFWASRFVCLLLENRRLLSSLILRLWLLFQRQAASLSPAHVLGLAAFLVHLQAAAFAPLVRLGPAVLPGPVPVPDALCSAVTSTTCAGMLFSIRLGVAAVSYGLCRGDTSARRFVPSILYKKLLFLLPRLFPEARTASQDRRRDDAPAWSSLLDCDAAWTAAVMQLWRSAAFQQLQLLPQFQLCFPEWLRYELSVQRSEDALSDAERQQYQRWACWEFYLLRPEEQGGCGGDSRKLCTRLCEAIMDQPLGQSSLEKLDGSTGQSGSCLPDLLSRLQELIYELEVSDLAVAAGRSAGLGDFLLELVSHRCASSSSSSGRVSSQLSLQRELQAWNRVLLALPAVLFFRTKSRGGRTSLDCSRLVDHIHLQQRTLCCPAGLLPCSLTAHLMKGLVLSAVRCDRPAEELDRVWVQMSAGCPLLVVSAVRWWHHLAPLLSSIWTRLWGTEPLPEQLQLLSDCRRWACSLTRAQVVQMPPAAVLIRAATLHQAFRDCEERQQNLREVLRSLDPEHHQVLVALLFLCLTDFLSELLHSEDKSSGRSGRFCSELLAVLVSSADWLRLFSSNEPEPDPVTLTTSDDCRRLMPWAVCSLLLQQTGDFLQRALCCPGFVHSAVLWYLSVLQLFLDGDTPPLTAAASGQDGPSRVLDRTRQLVLSLIRQAPPAALSSSQLRQVESRCAELDPELGAVLLGHLDPPSLSPEVDFL